jgi:hypothetical protein
METTQIFDILITILNNGTEKLFKQLGVTDIPSGEEKLRSLNSAEVRDLYEAIRPTPKPRKKVMKSPSAQALADCFGSDLIEPHLYIKKENFNFTRNWKNGCHRHTYLPDDYNKFFHNKKGGMMPKRKDKVITLIKHYNEMKMMGKGSLNLGGRKMIRVYWHKPNEPRHFVETEDFGIYRLFDFIYDTNKNGNNGNLFLNKYLWIEFVDECYCN